MVPHGTPDGIKHVSTSKKNELETKSTKHVENMQNLIPLDLQETRFRIEELPKITKARGADKYNKYQKMVSKWSQHPWKIGPWTQQKTKLKNRASKIKKYSKHDSQWVSESEGILGEMPLGALLVAQTDFCDQNVGPQRSQSAPNDREMNEKWHKRTPRVWKRTPKVDPFRIQAWRTARSAYNQLTANDIKQF